MSISSYAFPTSIHFGPGARRKIESIWKERNLKRPLVVTDRDLATLPVFQKFMEDLKLSHLEAKAYSGIFGNPVRSQVHDGLKAFQDHQADSIIAIGGGASLDCAKVIAMLTTNPGDLFDYVWPNPIKNDLPFTAALPTTAGTGSEVGRASLVSDDETHEKKIFFDQKLLPDVVFADPELSLSLPANPTAATGMDALTHLVEAFIAKGEHPMADGIALEGTKKVFENLKSTVDFAKKNAGADEAHIKARGEMLIAALMGAVAFQKGLGITHSCANALTTYYPNLHHGLVNGIMLPYVLKWNQSVCSEQLDRLGRACGLNDGNAFIAWVEKIKSQIGIPQKLSEVGVSEDTIEKMADHAVPDNCTSENPKETTKADFIELFKGAL